MNIGIIVFSHTNKTFSVASKLKEVFDNTEHTATVERVTTASHNPTVEPDIKLKDIPDVTNYDALIFASPVWAFSLCPVMKKYLNELASLDGKKVSLFVTQQLWFSWMGGNRAIKQMKELCQSKGANIINTGIVNWSNKKVEQQIHNLLECFKQI